MICLRCRDAITRAFLSISIANGSVVGRPLVCDDKAEAVLCFDCARQPISPDHLYQLARRDSRRGHGVANA